MALETFFEINLPYCVEKNAKGWQVLNREYKRIGLSENDKQVNTDASSTNFIGLNNHFINTQLFNENSGDFRHFDSQGTIFRFYLYDDMLNPRNSKGLENLYFMRLRSLFPLLNKDNTLHEYEEKYLFEKVFYNWNLSLPNPSTEAEKFPIRTETIALGNAKTIYEKVKDYVSNITPARFEQLADESTSFYELEPFDCDYKLTKVLVQKKRKNK